MHVIVVTGPHYGWDCVVGVFTDVSKQDLRKRFPENEFVLTEKIVQSDLSYYDDWDDEE